MLIADEIKSQTNKTEQIFIENKPEYNASKNMKQPGGIFPNSLDIFRFHPYDKKIHKYINTLITNDGEQ
ncbi:hypothetical protein CVD28_21640 [Bacillus sp. M6-12]|uniref:hypothetical protein n=1 Tax=Bacillus sp. M6-12 TaxID=2054166 RepID=UPI000C75CF91|nr:hypothetical protein [Bacillus sp. M6-12]PLS15620.1 hypothetical protein CVD28_21640 [Bacillus sp. M6-12]